MASARASAAARSRPRAAARRRPPAAVRPGAGVRWDRLARITLLVVLGGILLLYVGPAVSYVRTWREARAWRTDVRALQRENARLLARRRALEDPRSLELEARAMGMVRRGERAFVIEGLKARG
jgi:septum formation initiator